MRKDQPELKKRFKNLIKRVNYLEAEVTKQAIEISLRNVIIGELEEQIKDMEQKLLIGRIEHRRVLLGKPQLTKRG